MSLSTLKPVACRISPATGANGSPSKVSKVAMMNTRARPSLQLASSRMFPPLPVQGTTSGYGGGKMPCSCELAKEKEKPLERLTATSRREMMHLTAASVGLLSLLLPASAEARSRNATMRQKIMEKLEELRQKAGLSKPKDEGEGNKPNDEIEGKSKQQDSTKETKPKLKDEKKHATTTQKSTEPPTEEPSVPALPSIINGKTVETP